MIQSKRDLIDFNKDDAAALDINYNWSVPNYYKVLIRNGVEKAKIWRYERMLRYVEYLTNCGGGYLPMKIYRRYKIIQFYNFGIKLGFNIGVNCFDRGLCLAHAGTVIVNGNTRIGRNCRIHASVVIGNLPSGNEGDPELCVPQIGDNVYIGPGAKLFGKIKVGNNVRIAANAVVNKDIPDNVTVGGVPARVISQKSSTHGKIG